MGCGLWRSRALRERIRVWVLSRAGGAGHIDGADLRAFVAAQLYCCFGRFLLVTRMVLYEGRVWFGWLVDLVCYLSERLVLVMGSSDMLVSHGVKSRFVLKSNFVFIPLEYTLHGPVCSGIIVQPLQSNLTA